MARDVLSDSCPTAHDVSSADKLHDLHWAWKPFTALSTAELYAVLALRSAVFVVEQQCAFQDTDGHDQPAWHLLGRAAASHGAAPSLVAYLRVLPPGTKYPEPAIGRVVTARSHRGIGLGRVLMREGVCRTHATCGHVPIRISAQQHLQGFYASLGFQCAGAPYVEDGIAHIEMLLPV